MSASAIGTLIAVLVAALMAFLAYWFSTRQLKAQAQAASKAVDAQAYDRAEKITGNMVSRLEAEVDRLRAERTALQAERDRLHDLNDRLEDEVGKLRGFRDEAARLAAVNQRLEAEIARLGGHTAP